MSQDGPAFAAADWTATAAATRAQSADDEPSVVATLVSLPDEQTLEPLRSHAEQRRTVYYQTRWYLARDGRGRAVARYRVWDNRHLQPPFSRQLGWERYAPGGQLTDREVRYSSKTPLSYYH